jgi:hypothetical protein
LKTGLASQKQCFVFACCFLLYSYLKTTVTKIANNNNINKSTKRLNVKQSDQRMKKGLIPLVEEIAGQYFLHYLPFFGVFVNFLG